MRLQDLPWEERADGRYLYACIYKPRRVSIWYWTVGYTGVGYTGVVNTYSVRVYAEPEGGELPDPIFEVDRDNLDALEAQALLFHYLKG